MKNLELSIENMENTNYMKSGSQETNSLDLDLRNKGIYVGMPILAIIIAESLIYSGRVNQALWIHTATLVGLFLSITFTRKEEIFKISQALMLLPLLRLFNLSMPIFFEMTLYSLVFIYATLAVPVMIVAGYQRLTYEEIGITFRRIWFYLPLSILIGYGLAVGEYQIVRTEHLIPSLSLLNLLKLTVVMVLFVGVVEEIIFRSILQTRLNKCIGAWEAILISSILFGFMHSGYGTFYEILYATFMGIIIGYMFYKTQSLPFIALIHGFVNVFLFGFIPYLGPGLGLF